MPRLFAALFCCLVLTALPATAKDDGMTYGCRTTKDCAIVEIPSVCGRVPVCANKATAIPADDIQSTGSQSDLCEFEPIGGCYCLANKCRANRDMSHFPRYENLNQ